MSWFCSGLGKVIGGFLYGCFVMLIFEVVGLVVCFGNWCVWGRYGVGGED